MWSLPRGDRQVAFLEDLESFWTWNTSRDLASFLKAWSHPAPMGSFRTAACAGLQSPLSTRQSLPGVGSPSQGHGVIPEEVESILGRFEFPNLPRSSAALASGLLPRGSVWAMLGWEGNYRTLGWNLEWTQVESGVSPVKYLLVPCCLFFCCQGCEGGEGDRDLEEVKQEHRGAQQERAAAATV